MSQLRVEGKDASVLEVSDVEALFHEYHPRVYTYVRYRIVDGAEAEDLTSDIFERALTHLASYDAQKGSFSTWLFRIAHNTRVSHLKRQRRRNPHHVDLGEELEDLAADGPTPEQAILHKEETAQLLKCLGTLSSRRQEILSLRFAGRLTNREIARILRMNERTVSVTILRALRKLHQQIVESGIQ
jgi:RNA polymerase sigma-70 factor (ECF subfamily)